MIDDLRKIIKLLFAFLVLPVIRIKACGIIRSMIQREREGFVDLVPPDIRAAAVGIQQAFQGDPQYTPAFALLREEVAAYGSRLAHQSKRELDPANRLNEAIILVDAAKEGKLESAKRTAFRDHAGLEEVYAKLHGEFFAAVTELAKKQAQDQGAEMTLEHIRMVAIVLNGTLAGTFDNILSHL